METDKDDGDFDSNKAKYLHKFDGIEPIIKY